MTLEPNRGLQKLFEPMTTLPGYNGEERAALTMRLNSATSAADGHVTKKTQTPGSFRTPRTPPYHTQ